VCVCACVCVCVCVCACVRVCVCVCVCVLVGTHLSGDKREPTAVTCNTTTVEPSDSRDLGTPQPRPPIPLERGQLRWCKGGCGRQQVELPKTRPASERQVDSSHVCVIDVQL
jgi:hypothetical protein